MTRFVPFTFFALVAPLMLVGALAGQEVDKPSGFDGYLLDARGLEGDEREPGWREDFESQGVSWRYAYQDGKTNIAEHKRVTDVAHSGRASEHIEYEAVEQGVVVFAHYVDYPSVFDETAPTLWALSNRPGISIAALVVFPKTLRPDTGRPLTALVPGSSYQKPGEWQRLGFPDGLATALEKTAQALRGEHRLPVNVEGAYVRQILLVSEARSGLYSLWIDDLEIRERLQPELESLRGWERGATFEPINLLSARLKLSNTPVFAQSDDETDSYGREPFGLDEEKVAENNKIRLQFSEDVLRRSAPSHGAAPSASATPSFAESYAILKPAPEEYFAGIEELAPRRANMLDAANAQAAMLAQTNPAGVGQTSFLGDQGRVATANFDQAGRAKLERDGDANQPPRVALNQEPQDDLVLGSGTLTSPEDAVTETFVKKDGRLVPDVQFQDGTPLSSEKEAYVIRAIEYQGEALAFLKQLGFNAVWLRFAPTARIIHEANEAGIWLIAMPPKAVEVVTQAEVDAVKNNTSFTPQPTQITNDLDFGGQTVEPVYDCVLMWFLGEDMRRKDVAKYQAQVETLRQIDPRQRPTIAAPITGIDEYSSESRFSAILLKRMPILSSLDFNDYGEWLVNFQKLATNSRAVFWNTIQTQPEPTATIQRQFFSLADESPALVSYEQMRQAIRLSMRAKCRGLFFRSLSPLDQLDHKTQYRAAALEAINLELQLIAPWVAFGAPRTQPLETSAPELRAVVSKLQRSILVAPISTAPLNQYVMGQDAVNNWSGTVLAPEGYSPELLAPGALRKIFSKRTAGGCRFTLEEGSMNSTIFLTQSDVVAQKISERAPAYGARMAKLAISLARKRLDLYEETVYGLQYVEEHGAFPKSAPRSPALADVVSRSAALIDEAELCLRRRDPSQAYLVAERATREIRNAERNFWNEATKNEIARPVTPLSTSFYDTPAYLELYEKLVSGAMKATGPNLIACGDMENPDEWAKRGWAIYTEPSPLTTARVAFSADAAKTGATGIVATVSKLDSIAYEPMQVEAPSVYIETSFNVNVGSLICIQGWIKIPKDLTSSVDGVEIYDDQGGQPLALRFKRATDWKHFAFYRRASNNGAMRIRFAFSGIGTVYLDDVAAYVVE